MSQVEWMEWPKYSEAFEKVEEKTLNGRSYFYPKDSEDVGFFHSLCPWKSRGIDGGIILFLDVDTKKAE